MSEPIELVLEGHRSVEAALEAGVRPVHRVLAVRPRDRRLGRLRAMARDREGAQRHAIFGVNPAAREEPLLHIENFTTPSYPASTIPKASDSGDTGTASG